MNTKLIVSGLSGISIFLLLTSVAKAESYKHQFNWLDAKTSVENKNPHYNWYPSLNLSDSNFDKFSNLELASKTSFNRLLPTTNSEAVSTSDNPTSPVLTDYQSNAGSLGEETIIPETYLVQTTNVSQMRDVAPNDWAYEALRSLVNRYGCISGYPDQTFRGNQSLTRYEFAAGLNSCLEQIERLIASQETVSQEDLQTINRLTQEFETELQAIAGRVDNLDGRISWLEDHQFSTTTILNGEVIFALADAFGGDPPGGCTIIEDLTDTEASDGADCVNRNDPDTETVFTYTARLGLQSSFTGQDRLRMFLTTGNFDDGGFTNAESLNTYMARLGYQADLDDEVFIDILEYRFPAFNDKVVFYGAAYGFALSNVLTSNTPFFDIGRGSVSRFGQVNPILRIGGAMDAGVGFDWKIADPIRFQAAYGTRDSGDTEGGFFGADHSALGVQLLVQPTDSIVTGINYVNAYSSDGTLGTFTGSVNAETGGLWSNARVPSSLAAQNDPTFAPCCRFFLGDQPAQINAVGGSFQWNATEKINLAAWGGYTFTDFINALPDFDDEFAVGNPNINGIGDSAGEEPFAESATFSLSFGFNEPFGREGDLFGFIFGMPPKLVNAGPETRGNSVPFFEQVINNESETVVTDNNPNLDTVGTILQEVDARGLPRTDENIGQVADDLVDADVLPTSLGQEDEATSLHFEFFYRYTVNDHISITPGFFFVTNPGHIADNDTLYVGTIRTTFRF
ncbi:iron uptake porin [Pleurocapsa sp. PCC 7319]|uniref:iron uptake porin n=1 Tax=Pleurocapsa sp. PCC 7319 TaxID=118161 RepID=UPI000348BE01|nr:iron uptake porin [Pleurocapsa sp. PCC 7319]